jgi:hypothetical protein
MLLFIYCLMQAFASDNILTLSDPNYLPQQGTISVEFSSRAARKEIEYEANNIRIDQQDYKSNMLDLKILLTPYRRITFGVAGGFDVDREYELHFGPESSRYGDRPYQSNSRGFTDPEVILAYDFEPANKGWVQQLYLQFNPFDVEEAPRRIYRGGHDVFVEYRFGHFYQNGTFHGKLYSHYFGKKNFYLPGDSRNSLSEPYTEVGIHLGYSFHLGSRWRLRGTGMFGLSSDYEMSTPDIQRQADKGHLVGAELEISYFFNPQFIFGVRGKTESRIYNANNEQLSRDIDYEVEEQSFAFFVAQEWGPFW